MVVVVAVACPHSFIASRIIRPRMEQNHLSLRDVGDEGRVGATLAVALAAQTLKRPFTGMGRHKGVPYIRPNSA